MINQNKYELAIVIPAYKDRYLAETLESLCRQTDTRFTVYIGNDSSPFNLSSIVEEYFDKLDIIYFKFENNIGSKSLTKQWERCIDLTRGEDWIWLFSDDDIVKPDAVQTFYNNVNSSNLLYKFNTVIIDQDSNEYPLRLRYKKINDNRGALSSEFYITQRLACNGFRSYAVEYIFHKSLYNRFKFVDFPLAWSSDDATWLLYSLHNNSKITVLDSIVFWRLSGVNISSDVKSKHIVEDKIKAAEFYLLWLKDVLREHYISINYDLYIN